MQEWFLTAQFLRARLYGKVDTLEYQEKALRAYQWVVTYLHTRWAARLLPQLACRRLPASAARCSPPLAAACLRS